MSQGFSSSRGPSSRYSGRREENTRLYSPYNGSSNRGGHEKYHYQRLSIEDALKTDRALSFAEFCRSCESSRDADEAGYQAYIKKHLQAYMKRLYSRNGKDASLLSSKPSGPKDAEPVDLEERARAFDSLPLDKLNLHEGMDQQDCEMRGEDVLSIPQESDLLKPLQAFLKEHPKSFIAISNLPVFIGEEELMAHIKDQCPELSEAVGQKVYLGEPSSDRGFCREAWIPLERELSEDTVAKAQAAGSLAGSQLSFSLHKELSCRVRLSKQPEGSSALNAEFKAASALLTDLEGPSRADMFKDEFEATEDREQKLRVLDRLILYLRMVHNCCLHCGLKTASSFELFVRCGDVHMQTKDFPRPSTHHLKWESMVLFGSCLKNLKSHHEAGSLDAYLETSQIAKIDDSKYRCVQCQKPFRAPEFVLKHLKLKHEDFVAEAEKELLGLAELLRVAELWMFPDAFFPKTARKDQPQQHSREGDHRRDRPTDRHGHRGSHQRHFRSDRAASSAPYRYVDLDAARFAPDASAEISYDF